MSEGNTQVLACRDCGAEIFHKRKGGRAPTRCDECRENAGQQYQKQYRLNQGHKPMGETLALRCQTCGNAIIWVQTRGRRPSKCEECKAITLREKRLRESAARTAKIPQYDLSRECVDCGITFYRKSMKGATPLRCQSCRKKHTKAYMADYSRRLSSALSEVRRVNYEVSGRWSPCVKCGTPLSCTRMGKAREVCGKCWPNHVKARRLVWRQRNPEAWRAIVYRQNVKRRSMKGSDASESFDPFEVYARDRWVCQICRKRISRKRQWPDPLSVSLDHIIPVSEGGPHTRANTRTAHLGCNIGRSNRGGGEQLALLG